MTTKAQLRKVALSLPEVEETDGHAYSVAGQVFAALDREGNVILQLDPATVRASLKRCTITELPARGTRPAGIAIPLAELNGMELNNLVFKSWLAVAPDQLALRARLAMQGRTPEGPHALPADIGAPATRALLLAGITNLTELAEWTEREVANLHGLGPKAARILKDALLESGRSYRA